MKKIKDIAKKFNIDKSCLTFFGDYKAKINVDKIKGKDGRLILVTATNPTKFGEGKTTVSIGLTDAFNYLNKKAVVVLREASLGPVFGLKGGATGGGQATLIPEDDINLHFTGDFHAITTANNLLCSMIDNSLYFGNKLNLDPTKINFHRCVDLNDRVLRKVQIKINDQISREESFTITAASEMMSIMTLSKNIEELRKRIENICIGFDYQNKAVYAKALKCTDAICLVLKDALKPNLVQTKKGSPAIVHLGPFANISHGCNSVLATKTALKIADYAITEAGFGADLGAQKFLDFICRENKLSPHAIVCVTTVKSVKFNGGALEEDLEKANLQAITEGLSLVLKHVDNLIKIYNQKVIVAINKFPNDDEEELMHLSNLLTQKKIENVIVQPFSCGAKGCLNLAEKILEENRLSVLKYSYEQEDDIETKLNKICKKVYGAEKVLFSAIAKEKLKIIKKNNWNNLPVIIAKTQYSLSDDEKKIGVVSGFDITINDFVIQTGAGYIVAVAGKMLLMPGLNSKPNATKIKLIK